MLRRVLSANVRNAVEPQEHRQETRWAATATLLIVLAYLACRLFRGARILVAARRRRQNHQHAYHDDRRHPRRSHQCRPRRHPSGCLQAFTAAGWHPADAITLKTSIEIGISVVLMRPATRMPVSTLVYEGRRQDLAFEKPVGIERRPAPSRSPVADRAELGGDRASTLARLGELRPRRRSQPRYRSDHPPHRP